jgi:hypothetical protein
MNTRNLSEKNFYSRPLRVSFLLGSIIGSLMLMTLAAPSAHADNLLVYYNFNQGARPNPLLNDFPAQPYLSVPPGFEIGIQLNNSTAMPFPAGNLQFAATVDAGTVNRAAGDATTGGSIDARGNNSTATGAFCFTIGAFSTAGQTDINISFALLSTGNPMNPGGFDQLNLLYSTNGTTFTNFATILGVRSVTTFTKEGNFLLPAGANNQPTLYIEFCFTDVKDNDTRNNTYIDNIQITGVPEPGTVIGGALGLLGLCWSQRRWLLRSLRLGRT